MSVSNMPFDIRIRTALSGLDERNVIALRILVKMGTQRQALVNEISLNL